MKKIILFFLTFFLFILNTTKSNLTIEESNNFLKNSLEQEYNFKIFFKNTFQEIPDYTLKEELNSQEINNALKTIFKIIPKFNREFFNQFYNYNYNGLNINFVSDIISSNPSLKVSAFSLDYQKTYTIVLNIKEQPLEKILCHELMHIMEFNMLKGTEPFPNWSSYNPQDFYYNYSYNSDYSFNYTLYAPFNNIYFIDYYAYSYPEEDRARIFENICAYNVTYKYYPHIEAKALYLKEELLKAYPSLKNTSLFLN